VPVDFKLYLITDRKQVKVPLPQAVRLALEGGVRAIQLREKDMHVRDLLGLARELRSLTNDFGARLFVNDRVDVAVEVGADGIHLGHASMPVDAARKVVGSGMMIGVSTHSPEEAGAAELGGADFVTYGPIYATPSKAGIGKPVGKDSIKSVKNAIDIPIFALGGIESGNVLKVMAAGADGISLISGIMAADDIRKAAKKFMDSINFMDRIACNYCTPR
jgi:thiamine-phosphate pyrophosphorylase